MSDGVSSVIELVSTGAVTATTYDTAMLAALRVTEDGGAPALFPETVDWLRRNQHPEGSWGRDVPVFHDRLVSTLAAVYSLACEGDARSQAAVARGVGYLRDWDCGPDSERHETAGFGPVLANLLYQSKVAGLDVPFHDLGGQGRRMPRSALEALEAVSDLHVART